MLCLGIESTAHTFAAAVVNEKGKILSDARDSYTTKTGGIIPTEAAMHHKNVHLDVIKKALEDSKINPSEIKLISYSHGPGLGPCLQVGLEAVKDFSIPLKAEVIGVNHCLAHLTSGLLFTKAQDPVFIFTSGANTQIIAFEGNKYRIFGETLDVGLGNALDKFGRSIGLGFPSGPLIEKLAKNGTYVSLPHSVKGMDLAFSGIVTATANLFKKGIKKEDLCFSIQETFFSMLVEVTERAMAHTEKKEALLIGGVAANRRLCEMLNIMCKERKAKFHVVPLQYAGDNAVMIAWEGLRAFSAGMRRGGFAIKPYERVDEVC